MFNQKLRKSKQKLLRLAVDVANQHYRAEHPDLGFCWALTEEQMRQLREAAGDYQRARYGTD